MFIVIEGINGAGKSTLIKLLEQFISSKGLNTLVTKEPGTPHTKLGGIVSDIVKAGAAGKISIEAEALLFAADRIEHCRKVILPALKANKVVISDRYYYSSVAFQGYARGLDKQFILQINQIAISEAVPDLVVLIDLPVVEALKRLDRRGSNPTDQDIFESENLEFHEKVRQGYLEMSKTGMAKFLVIDGLKTPEKLVEEIKSHLTF